MLRDHYRSSVFNNTWQRISIAFVFIVMSITFVFVCIMGLSSHKFLPFTIHQTHRSLTSAGVPREIERNCGPTNDALVDHWSIKPIHELKDVSIEQLWQWICRDEPELSHVRIHSGAAHEYMVEIISLHPVAQFRIYQADASGFSLDEWLEGDSANDAMTDEVLQERYTLYAHKFCPLLR
eukprot:560870_1